MERGAGQRGTGTEQKQDGETGRDRGRQPEIGKDRETPRSGAGRDSCHRQEEWGLSPPHLSPPVRESPVGLPPTRVSDT